MSRVGGWIGVANAGKMYPLDPREDEISVEVIAHALSHICRFTGHTRVFYSVAEHSCHVHDLIVDHLKLSGLLHDASEAYLCDLPRPLKRSAQFAAPYQEAEDRLMQVIADKFGFCWPMCKELEDADNALLGTECLQLMAPLHPDWHDTFIPVRGLQLPCWSPDQARLEFMNRFASLTSKKGSDELQGEGQPERA